MGVFAIYVKCGLVGFCFWAWVWFKMDWNVEMDRVGLKLEFGVGQIRIQQLKWTRVGLTRSNNLSNKTG